MIGGDSTADPRHLAPVVFYFWLFEQLVEVKRGINCPQREAIAFRVVVHLIGGNQRCSPGNVLDDDVGIAGNILGPVLRNQARIKIVYIAGLGADDDRNGSALVEGRLSKRSRNPPEAEHQDENRD